MDNNNLPSGWISTKLEDIIYLKNGAAFKSKSYKEEGIPLLRISNINNDSIDFNKIVFVDENDEYTNFIVEYNDILIAMSGATTGKIGLYKIQEVAYQNQRVGNIKPYGNHLLIKKFIFYFLKYQKKLIEKLAYGGAQPNISSKMIENINITLPPLNEQKRIVAKIEKLFSNLDKSEQHLVHLEKQLKRYRRSVLKNAFTGTWKYMQWKDIVNIKNGKHYTEVLNENGKYPIYGSAGIINYADEYLCKENTTIIGRKGTINKPLYIKEKFWNIDTAFGLEVDNNILDSMFFYYFTQSFNFMDLNQSTAIPSLTKSNLQKIIMPVPATIEEQKEIVKEIEKHLSIIDKLETVVQKSIKESKRLRQSILKQAFEGKLVEQDPSDESATILLEKIAKEKEEYKQATKKRKKK